MTVARILRAAMLALAVAAIAGAARADDSAEGEIRAALEQWRLDFNARKTDRICDLFATELRYDFQGLPEQNYEQLCARLNKALADTARTFNYGLDVKEVIVRGSFAVVRLTWISTLTTADGKSETANEPGLDVFERQPDGAWKIIRYIAYPETE
jgi:steroid delta-isomerase